MHYRLFPLVIGSLFVPVVGVCASAEDLLAEHGGIFLRIGGTDRLLSVLAPEKSETNVLRLRVVDSRGQETIRDYVASDADLTRIERAGSLVVHFQNASYADIVMVELKVISGFSGLFLNPQGISKGDVLQAPHMAALYSFGIFRIS